MLPSALFRCVQQVTPERLTAVMLLIKDDEAAAAPWAEAAAVQFGNRRVFVRKTVTWLDSALMLTHAYLPSRSNPIC